MLTDEGRSIANKARNQGMWLYDPEYKKWYSPEDFEHIFHYANLNSDLLKRLQVRHPKEGIKAGFKRLVEIQTRLEAFIDLVMKYYKK